MPETINAQRLAHAIEVSGLSNRKFATCVLVVDESSVRRWLAGEDMPQVVADFLELYVIASQRPHCRKALRTAARLIVTGGLA